MKAQNSYLEYISALPDQLSMTDEEFHLLSGFIYKQCGIKLTPYKKLMLTSRLQKRLRQHGMKNFMEYYDLVNNSNRAQHASQANEELILMLNEVSTNKTDFFREPYHFDFLQNTVLPILSGDMKAPDSINIWSAGCSTGEEAYSIAMVADDFLCDKNNSSFSILCSDISTKVLDIARMGIYSEEKILPIPAMFSKKYLMKGTGAQQGMYRIVPELRKKIKTSRINLTDEIRAINTPMDIIFFRNVMIYFDHQTQRKVINDLYATLNRGGYLFIGHSETLHDINDDFKMVAPKVYIKP